MTGSLLNAGPRARGERDGPRRTAFVQLRTDVQTSAEGFGPLLRVEIATRGTNQLACWFSMSGDCSSSAQRTGKFRLLIDGTAVAATAETFRNERPGSAALVYRSRALRAGLHAVALEWARDAGKVGPIRIRAHSDADEHHGSLLVEEVQG